MTAETNSVLVVGAGLGGLAAARDLARAGQRVTLLDKSRGVSGRAATRRAPEGERLDHGAQYLTARSERLRALVEGWQREGWLREWTRGFPTWRGGALEGGEDGHPRYVPPAGMSAVGRHLGRDLPTVGEATVTSLARGGAGWLAFTAAGERFEAASLLLNLPAPQLLPLLDGLNVGEAAEAAARVRFDPCWTLLVGLEHDLDVPWKGLKVEGHPAVSWLARDHTRRDPGAPPTLVVHATADWTRAHLELEREAAAAALLEAARDLTGSLQTRWTQGHRWRYSTPTVFYPQPCHWDPELKLGWCGDWCRADAHGPRVEAALLSGWALAGSVLGG